MDCIIFLTPIPPRPTVLVLKGEWRTGGYVQTVTNINVESTNAACVVISEGEY